MAAISLLLQLDIWLCCSLSRFPRIRVRLKGSLVNIRVQGKMSPTSTKPQGFMFLLVVIFLHISRIIAAAVPQICNATCADYVSR